MSEFRRGIAVCHFNRTKYLPQILEGIYDTMPVGTKVVVCDDGSTEDLTPILSKFKETLFIRGNNLGVAANKNRALYSLRDTHLLCILEDDLVPTKEGWFEKYEKAYLLSGIHHFCRVQDKVVPESISPFTEFLQRSSITPIYGSSPRGDLTFLTNTVLHRVGGFNPLFRGAGYAHGEWSERVHRSGLIPHPLKWVDIVEARDSFKQIGDTEGGRWDLTKSQLKKQLQKNKQILDKLNKTEYVYHPLVLE